MRQKKKIIVLTTGGTIEKTYDERDGSLSNKESIIHDKIISKLRLPYTEIIQYSILAKDSLYMDDDDREFISVCIKKHLKSDCPVVVLHGTDTMADSAKYCYERLVDVKHPVIFTGAMRPLGLDDSDAFQNFVEAIFASKIVAPAIYISFHNQLFKAPKVRKNLERGTFEELS
ncbi:MAG TPA: asparaginase domain-containing protein [Bacteriovoracaceae bacterium]|nr:asparaginase domain-containing protein [Bacteriovoracaceae bacterium]